MKITLYLILMMVFIFFLQNIPGFFESLSFIPSQALAKPWMFITSIFLHADYIHLFYNMFALFFFGTYLENIVGVKNYIKIFLISGLAGNILFFFTTHDPKIPAVGASGAIFGIIGALTALRPYEIIYFFFIPMPLVVAAFLWAIGSLIGMLFPSSIAHSAHLAGLIAGFLYARWLKKIYSKKYTRRIIWY